MNEAEFLVEETHRFAENKGTVVQKTSKGLGWTGAYLSVQSEEPYTKSFEAIPDIFVSVIDVGPMKARVGMNESVCQLRAPSRSVCIFPDNMAFDTDLQSKITTTHLHLRRSLLDQVAGGMYRGDPADIQLLARMPTYDPMIDQLCHAMRDTVDEDPASSALFVEHMTCALAAHLIRKHSNAGGRRMQPPKGGGLSEWRMNRTREIIEARLSEQLTLAELAADACMGPDHFGRLFKRTAGISLYQFVIQRRIDRARHLLAETNLPIAQIALECGFADQVHLTRVFGRAVGTTPAAFRREMRK